MLTFEPSKSLGPLVIAASLALFSGACKGKVSVTFPVGCTDCTDSPVAFTVTASDLAPPDGLRDDSGATPTVASIMCGPMGACPSTAGVTVSCNGGVCDPAPQNVDVPVGDVIDLRDLSSELRDVFTKVDRIEILDAQYAVSTNTSTIDLGQVELYWGPASATAIDPAMGVTLLGTVPAIAAGDTGTGMVTLDDGGRTALSDYLVGTSTRIRFFARTRVDINPGDPWPDGSLRVTALMHVQATGSTL